MIVLLYRVKIMLNIHPLYSSSSGNMFHIESKKTNILLDVGVSYKAINEGLKEIDKELSDISAVLITHEHIDHIKGLSLLCRKNNIPIYACGKTASYLKNMLNEKNIPADITKITYGQTFKINDLQITPFETSHDAVCPCGYNIQGDNCNLTYATDLGYVSDEVFEYLKLADYIVLEANYDTTMLDFGRYPYPLKHRIKSITGHLSNDDTASTVARLAKLGKDDFLFAHLSQNNNNPDILINTLYDELLKNDITLSNINLNVASKSLSCEVYNI